MKKVMSALCMVVLMLAFDNASAQFRKIPAEVTDAFKQKYPNATGVEWKDKLTAFQAGFQLNDGKYEARYNSKGEWQETVKAIEQDQLPAAVKDGFEKSKFTDREIAEVSHIEKKDGTEQYRMLVRKSELEKKYLFFDKQGKLLREAITL